MSQDNEPQEVTAKRGRPAKTQAEPDCAAEVQKSVTFIWNNSIKKRIIVMSTAKVRFTEAGAITDPDHPAHRIPVINGIYKTSDPEEIEFLKGHPDFGSKNPDGFNIMKEITAEEEVKMLLKRHGLTKEKLTAIVGAE